MKRQEVNKIFWPYMGICPFFFSKFGFIPIIVFPSVFHQFRLFDYCCYARGTKAEEMLQAWYANQRLKIKQHVPSSHDLLRR